MGTGPWSSAVDSHAQPTDAHPVPAPVPIPTWHLLWPQAPLSKSPAMLGRGAKLGGGGKAGGRGKPGAGHGSSMNQAPCLLWTPASQRTACPSRTSVLAPSAYRLNAELADGVVHQDHTVLHAHPDVSVGPAALVRPVLEALLLHGNEQHRPVGALGRPSACPPVITGHTHQAPVKQCSELGKSTGKCLLINGETEARKLLQGSPEPVTGAFLIPMPGCLSLIHSLSPRVH